MSDLVRVIERNSKYRRATETVFEELIGLVKLFPQHRYKFAPYVQKVCSTPYLYSLKKN